MLLLALLDCTQTGRLLSVCQLLELMDSEEPEPDGCYINVLSDMNDFGIEDVLDVYEMEDCYLGTFGDLGRGGAQRLRRYARDKILILLGVLKAEESEPSIQEINMTDYGRVMKWQVSVERGGAEEIIDVKEEEGAEEVKEEGGETTDEADEETGDMAYSMQEEV
jgi:hypothetical protein